MPHKVSIIIPAAAAPSNVIECVEAAREYHADNVEIVVVTNSAGIEKELSAYGKIKVLRQDMPVAPRSNCNAALIRLPAR
jgi:hypothetical protein